MKLSTTRTRTPGNIEILASHRKPGRRVMTRCCDVNGFHRSPAGDRLKVPPMSIVTAVTMGYPSLSTARK
jgi:hypothetical protein